jgi:hypothetical protein
LYGGNAILVPVQLLILFIDEILLWAEQTNLGIWWDEIHHRFYYCNLSLISYLPSHSTNPFNFDPVVQTNAQVWVNLSYAIVEFVLSSTSD